MIGAETFSRLLDWQDRATCVLFGDGAGAVVLRAEEQPGGRDRPWHPTRPICAPTAATYKLYVDGGPSSTEPSGTCA